MVTQRNTPALFGAGQIDAISEETIIAHQREHSTAARLVGLNSAQDSRIRGKVARLADGRIGRFGWKLEFATLNDFVKAACANELGLSNPGRPQAVPLGKPAHKGKGTDLTEEQCTLMTDFIRSLPAPVDSVPSDPVQAAEVKAGKALFSSIGCADCHRESLGTGSGTLTPTCSCTTWVSSSSRARATTVRSSPRRRFATTSSSREISPLQASGGPLPYGVLPTVPHTFTMAAPRPWRQAILAHGGEAIDVTARFKERTEAERKSIISFLGSLKAPAVQPSAAPGALAAR